MNQFTLSKQGFEIFNNFMSAEWVNHILHDIENTALDIDVTGIRHIDKKLHSVSAYLASLEFIKNTQPYFTSRHKLTRAILFNKTPETNWSVAWHQDRTLAVSEKFIVKLMLAQH